MEAFNEKRIRASFLGTVGYLTGKAKKPLSCNIPAISKLFSFDQHTMGTMCELPLVSKPFAINTFRKRSETSANLILKS